MWVRPRAPFTPFLARKDPSKVKIQTIWKPMGVLCFSASRDASAPKRTWCSLNLGKVKTTSSPVTGFPILRFSSSGCVFEVIPEDPPSLGVPFLGGRIGRIPVLTCRCFPYHPWEHLVRLTVLNPLGFVTGPSLVYL